MKKMISALLAGLPALLFTACAAGPPPAQSLPQDAVSLYSHFFYDALDENEKGCYLAMYTAIQKEEECCEIPHVSSAQAQAAYAALLADRPDVYWTRDYWYQECENGVVFQPEYLFTLAERGAADSRMTEALKTLERDVDGLDEYEKARTLFERTVQWVAYEETAENGQTLYGALLQRRAVCAGWARLYQYLLARQGVETAYIEGTVEDGARHAWIAAKIDGEWAYFDPTSAGTQQTQPPPGCRPPPCQYAFFGMTDADLTALGYKAAAHLALPAATSLSNTYYSRTGNLLSTYDRADVEERLAAAVCAGEDTLSLRFLAPEAARQAVEDLFGPKQGMLLLLAHIKERVPALISDRAYYTFYPELGCLDLYLLQEM